MQKDLTVQKAEEVRLEKYEIACLQEQIDFYKKELDMLMINQAACLFERAICSHVLPEVCEKNKFVSIRQLLNYLDDSKKLPKDLKLS